MRLAAPAAALCALLAFPAFATAANPKPKRGKSFVVKRVSGTVKTASKEGGRLSTLRGTRVLKRGAVVDASRGRVKLTSAADSRGRRLQSATFHDGAFSVTQKRTSALTDITLVGGDFSDCTAPRQRAGVFSARSRRAKRRLWGRGRGRFRTRGRNGSATVRGTTWLTEDGCEGTTAMNREGKVDAKTQDLEYQLDPGQSVIFACNPDGIPGIVGLYCLAVLSQPAAGELPVDIVAFGIAAQTPDPEYELCVVEPNNAISCGAFPFGPDDNGFRAAGVGCAPTQAGSYAVGWRMRGTLIGALPFEIKTPSSEAYCVSDPPRPGIDPPPGQLKQTLSKAARAGR